MANKRKVSKFLSYVLRHNPEKIGIRLDPAGWTPVDDLLEKAAENGMHISQSQLNDVVHNSEKKRFSFSDDGEYIRANYGHSINVELGYEPKSPPAILYHGTAEGSVNSILRSGLHSANRQYVHLSSDKPSAKQVGSRHGKPVILEIDAGQAYRDGHTFYQSDAGIWLTDTIPPDYISN